MKSRTVVFCALVILSIVSAAWAKDPPSPSDTVFVIPIEGDIEPSRTVFIRRSIDRAVREGAGILIFEIDTFGGRVDSALQIATLIGSVDNAATIAFVPARAEGTGVSWSAGALISFACNYIYMAYGTSMGAAAPVFQTQAGTEMAPEKTVSAVRTQMAALAEKNDYPRGVALAMVDMDAELVEVKIGGRIRAVLSEDVDSEREAAEAGGDTFTVGKTISAAGKLLALTAGEMEKYQVSSGTVDDLDELLSVLGLEGAEVLVLEETVPDQAVAILTSAAVSSILILLGLVTLYMEITSPGFGVPGTVAVICFAVVFIGSALLGTVGSLELLMFLAGIALLVIEIFLIPGFGVTGITGIILIGSSLVLSRQDFIIPQFEWQWDLLRKNLTIIGASLAGSFLVFGIVLRFLPNAPLFKRLVLNSGETAVDGFTISLPESVDTMAGRTGKVVTSLRPVGKAEFDGEILEVQTDGEFVDSGSAIRIVEVRGNRIIVTAAEGPV